MSRQPSRKFIADFGWGELVRSPCPPLWRQTPDARRQTPAGANQDSRGGAFRAAGAGGMLSACGRRSTARRRLRGAAPETSPPHQDRRRRLSPRWGGWPMARPAPMIRRPARRSDKESTGGWASRSWSPRMTIMSAYMLGHQREAQAAAGPVGRAGTGRRAREAPEDRLAISRRHARSGIIHLHPGAGRRRGSRPARRRRRAAGRSPSG